MTQSRLTISVNCSYVKDWNKTLDFLRRLDPAVVVAVIDNLSNKNRILEIQRALPYAKIIARCVIIVHDEGEQKELDGSMHLAPQGAGDTNHSLVSPMSFLSTWGELGRGGLSLSYFNEPQVAKATPENVTRQVQHMLETINLATQSSISLVVGNWGAGHYLDERFDDVIDAVGKQPDLHALGVHAYAPIDLTHCLDAIIARRKARNLAKPKIHITEFGWDSSGPGDPLNGYKSQPSVNTGVKFGNWEVDTLVNAYAPYIASGDLESVATFGWGYAASFPNDDVETDPDWQATVLNAKDKGLLAVNGAVPIVSPIPAKDLVYGEMYRLNMPGKIINVYPEKSISFKPLGSIPDQAVVEVGTPAMVDHESWLQVRYTVAFAGWGWIKVDLIDFRKTTTVPIVVDDSPLPPLPPPAPKMGFTLTPDQIVAFEAFRSAFKATLDQNAAEIKTRTEENQKLAGYLSAIDGVLANAKGVSL